MLSPLTILSINIGCLLITMKYFVNFTLSLSLLFEVLMFEEVSKHGRSKENIKD